MLRLKKSEARKGCKKPLKWTDEANQCFNMLKEKMLNGLSLYLIDPDKDFVVETDSSGYAVGCVLKQMVDEKLRPVAFWSRQLTPGQRKWSTREQETYAIGSN